MLARVKSWEDHQHYKDRAPPCFIYVNSAIYQGLSVAKVGFAKDPRRRLCNFNNGLRHRRRKGYISEHVSFEAFFYLPAPDQQFARRVERKFLDACKPAILREMGSEVVGFCPAVAAEMLCRLVDGEVSA